MDGRKHTVQQYRLLLGRLFISAVMENLGPGWWGKIWRDRMHAVVHMTNQKGHDKLGKGNIYFLAFECVSHPVENKINSFIKSTRRVR